MRRDTSSWMCSDATSMHRYRAYAMRGILLLVRRQRVHSDSLRSRPSTVIFDLWMLGMKRVLVRPLGVADVVPGVARLTAQLALCHFLSLAERARRLRLL